MQIKYQLNRCISIFVSWCLLKSIKTHIHHTHTHALTHTHTHARTHTRTHARMHAYTHIHTKQQQPQQTTHQFSGKTKIILCKTILKTLSSDILKCMSLWPDLSFIIKHEVFILRDISYGTLLSCYRDVDDAMSINSACL